MGLLKGTRRDESLTGLEICSRGLRMVRLERSNPTGIVKNFGMLTWERGRISEKLMSDPNSLGELIRTTLDEQNIRIKGVVCALPAQSVFAKRITLPDCPWHELKAQVELEALSLLPQGGLGVRIDFHPMKKVQKDQVEVLLVAARESAINLLHETAEVAGLDLVVVDVDAFAIYNFFLKTWPDHIVKTCVLLGIGDMCSVVAVQNRGGLSFVGDWPVGVDMVVEKVADSLAISEERAYQNVMDDSDFEQSVVLEEIGTLCEELNRRISLLGAMADIDEPITQVVLCGEGARLKSLRAELERSSGIPVEVLDPLKDKMSGKSENADNFGAQYALAAGLALRTGSDRRVRIPEKA
jgi:type IV pilus assembly protein PilM